MRNKVEGSQSVAQVMTTLSSMLEQRGYSKKVLESLRAAEALSETPGLSDSLTSILGTVVAELESHVETAIQSGFSSTQSALATAHSAVETSTSNSLTKKAAADTNDEIWYSCVDEEKTKLEEAEAAAVALSVAIEAAVAPCNEMNTRASTPFLFSVEPGSMSCDLSIGNCDAALSTYLGNLEDAIKTQQDNMQGDIDAYETAKNACDAANAEIEAKEAAKTNATTAFDTQVMTCMNAHEEREVAMCMFGKELQVKHANEQAFSTLIEEVTGTGGVHSEPDRQLEWKTVSVVKCMLTRVRDGAALDNASLSTCEESVDYQSDVGVINLYEDTFNGFRSAFDTTQATITFSTGKTWETGQTSADYHVNDFHPAFDSNELSAPFDFCP